ncbi:odorant receptor 49b-like [Zophobas morio]|uniref:odorant receptor 49b-like n=1 Tax=Zophobas morio TaxID=2755281 RepID=UPI00308294EB
MNIFFVYDNLEALTESIFITVTDILAWIKVYFFIRNVELRKKLIRTLTNATFQPKNLKQIHIVQPALKTWKRMYITFSVMTSYTVLIWTTFPFLDKSFKERNLPFAAWYPYDSKKSPFYELTYVYQVLGMWYLTLVTINMDTLMAALMVLIGAQCDILCNNLQTVNISRRSGFLSETSFNENLIKCIKHHREIVRFAVDCNKFFSMIVLGQFFTSTVVLAVTMFQMTLVDPVSTESFTHLSYVNALTAQLFMYCWFGNEVEVKLRLGYHVFI